MTAACVLAGIGTFLGLHLSVLTMAIGLMVLPPLGPMVLDRGRRCGSRSLEQLGSALQWLWCALFLGFGATLLVLAVHGRL